MHSGPEMASPAGGPAADPEHISSNPPAAAPTILDRVPLAIRVVFYGFFFLAVFVGFLPWLAHRIDLWRPQWHVEVGPVRFLGWAIAAVFLVVYIRTSYYLTSRGRGAYVEFDPPREFVSGGPYRWMRNPIAGCVVMILLGEAIAFSSTGVALLFLAAIPLAHAQAVLVEEPLLEKRFGPTYAEYKSHVPRWIPRSPGRNTS